MSKASTEIAHSPGPGAPGVCQKLAILCGKPASIPTRQPPPRGAPQYLFTMADESPVPPDDEICLLDLLLVVAENARLPTFGPIPR